jgi:hypothetical protein
MTQQLTLVNGSYISSQRHADMPGRINLVANGLTASATVEMTPDNFDAINHGCQGILDHVGFGFVVQSASQGSIALQRDQGGTTVLTITNPDQSIAQDLLDLADVAWLRDAVLVLMPE